jgi:hypothetical protein
MPGHRAAPQGLVVWWQKAAHDTRTGNALRRRRRSKCCGRRENISLPFGSARCTRERLKFRLGRFELGEFGLGRFELGEFELGKTNIELGERTSELGDRLVA